MSLEDSGFVGPSLSANGASSAPPGAAQYSFFGDLAAEDNGLEGALEDGLEAPPEEEEIDPDVALGADEDLSYASMFATALERSGDEDRPSGTEGPRPGSQPSLFEDEPAATPPPFQRKPGSIALGSLLAGHTPSETAFSSGGGMRSGGGGSFLHMQASFPPTPLSGQQQGGSVAAYSGGQATAGTPQGATAPQSLTAQELEAQLLAGAGVGPPQPPQQQAQQQLPPFMQPYSGMPPTMPPPHMHFPPFVPPQGFPGYGPAPPPGFAGPPTQPRQQPGVFTPEMIMQQQAQQAMMAASMQAPPGGMQPHAASMQAPPGGMQPHAMFMQLPQPPPSLGGGMQRGPPPPPAQGAFAPYGGPGGAPVPAQQMQQMQMQQPRPAPAVGFRPHAPVGFAPVGAPPEAHPHANLAQRLRALHLADRPEAEGYPVARRRHSSLYMSAEEIESIMYMQWRPLHQGPPYTEDYYYQAFVFKYYGRRNRRSFCPESVRELAPTERVEADEVAFVKLEGLGKVAFSNIRRPRPLMDVASDDARAAAAGAAAAEKDAAAAPAAAARRLGQEPMLAARVMIEDCMALILDVQDIDRIFIAAGGAAVENERALRQRRMLLVDGLAASLRLPEAPLIGQAAPGKEPVVGDGVFLRLLVLPKGKNLAARALRVLYPPPEEGRAATAAAQPNLRILWAVLRNLRSLFGDAPAGGAAAGGGRAAKVAPAARDQAASAAKVAVAAAGVAARLHSPRAVCEALEAVLAGDLDAGDGSKSQGAEAALMPLLAPAAAAAPGGDASGRRPWLADVLAALLQRAAEFELPTATATSADGATSAEGAELAVAWRRRVSRLHAAVLRHVAALRGARDAAEAAAEVEAAEEIDATMPVALVRALLPHCSAAQQEELRALLGAVGV